MADIAINETTRLISSDKVDGTAVYNRAGEKLGHVRNFMVDKQSGKAQYAVLQFGGLFGIGGDYYPLPWDMLTYEPSQGGYVVDVDKSKLENAPRYNEKVPEYDEDYGRQVHGHYGLSYPFI